MKKVFTKISVMTVAVAAIVFASSFKKQDSPNFFGYQLNLTSKVTSATGETWTWSLTNPNPGNGDNGTLQDVSHLSMPLTPAAEAALVSAEYSFDGTNWHSVTTSMDRDPSIRFCTGVDVLKFDVGTLGTRSTHYRVNLNSSFQLNPFATSFIKTGGGRTGCNAYIFAGIGAPGNDN